MLHEQGEDDRAVLLSPHCAREGGPPRKRVLNTTASRPKTWESVLKLQLILLLAATLQVISLTATFAMASVYSTESAALRAVHDWIPAH
jgi:hypothetical protein